MDKSRAEWRRPKKKAASSGQLPSFTHSGEHADSGTNTRRNGFHAGSLQESVVALVMPVPSVSWYSMLGRFKNPVLALALFKRYKSKAYIRSTIVAYAAYLVYCSYWVNYLLGIDSFGVFRSLLLDTAGVIFLIGSPVVAALAATSVVSERRSGTLMSVRVSLLRPFDIVWGKVVASVAPVLFPVGVCMVTGLLFSLLSLTGMVEVYKLSTVEEAYWLLATVGTGVWLVVSSMAVSIVCVLVSTFAKSSAAAVVISYGMIFMAIILAVIASALVVGSVEILCDPYRGRSCEIGTYDLYHLIGRYRYDIYYVLRILLFSPLAAFSLVWACRRLRLPAKNTAAV
ncbi:MAG: hypothetical protein OXI96_02415 [Acidimicrobiaceae bacterium]|nr:hypothetical protein [Acidimicrobiaceae bacterium]